MPEMHLRWPGFTFNGGGPFTETKERIQKFKKTWNSRCIYQNDEGKFCYQHQIAYGDFKYLSRRTASDKVLLDKALKIAENAKYDGYQCGVASAVLKFFDKKSVVLLLTQEQELILKTND